MTRAARLASLVRVLLVIVSMMTVFWTWSWIRPRVGDLFTIMWYLALSSR